MPRGETAAGRGASEIDGSAHRLRQLLGLALSPVVKVHQPRLLACHMLVNRHDTNTCAAQRLEHRLQFTFEYREIAVDDGLPVSAGKARPGVHAHGFADRHAVHRHRPAEAGFVHAIVGVPRFAENRIQRRGADVAFARQARKRGGGRGRGVCGAPNTFLTAEAIAPASPMPLMCMKYSRGSSKKKWLWRAVTSRPFCRAASIAGATSSS